MWHLQEEDMVSLVFDEVEGDRRAACKAHQRACPDCRESIDRLVRAAELLGKEPMEPAPPFAWSKIRARIERSRAPRDWSEPAWTPLVLGNIAGIALVTLTIALAGKWLESASLWDTIRTWPLARGVGPRSLTALLFFGAGSLVTLALTPIFWWESRLTSKHIVKKWGRP